jgi:pectate lyase
VKAFPTAEGFGANTPGGRGGRVIEVTNLNDSGAGSLREALTASGARIVVVRVAGTISVKSQIAVTSPYLTFAGQTAPGDGITVRNDPGFSKTPIKIATHDVVIRYLRVRTGAPQFSSLDTGNTDALDPAGAYDTVFDHCSFSWSTDEVFTSGDSHDFTIQWSIISEGLNHATHPEGPHSKGMHLRDEAPRSISSNISIHHNLLAHNLDRNPNINATGTIDLVNNVFYDATRWTELKDKFGEPNVNVVGNYYKKGPGTGTDGRTVTYEIFYYNNSSRFPKVYPKGNIGWHRPTDDLAETLLVAKDPHLVVVDKPFPAAKVTTTSASDAYAAVLANVGAVRPIRDGHDTRVVNDTKNGTGKIIDDPSEVGGWLTMKPGTPPTDSDHDGMPDAWETEHGLNPTNASDGPKDSDGDGYTNVEEYLNSI